MSKRIIAIDCDDVIVATAPAILDYYNEHFGTAIALEDLYSKDLVTWAADDEQTAIDRVDAFLRTTSYQTMEPFREAVEAIAELAKRHELHIVTGRPDFLGEATQNMLEQYFPGIFRSVEFTNFFGKQSRSKADVCQEMGADLLIDDHLHHAAIVAERGIEVFLFGNYPWNQAEALPHGVRRMHDWPAITAALMS